MMKATQYAAQREAATAANAAQQAARTMEPGLNQALAGKIAEGNAKQIAKGSGLGTLGNGGSVIAGDGSYKGPGVGEQVGGFAGGLIGGALAGAAVGAAFGGVGAVPGFFIGLGGGLIGGWIGGEIGKGFDNWWDQNHPKNPNPNTCDSSSDPPCYYDSSTGRFICQISN